MTSISIHTCQATASISMHLIASTAKQLVSKIGGNRAVGGNRVDGWGVINGKDGYFSFGKVASQFRDPTSDEMKAWIVGPVWEQ